MGNKVSGDHHEVPKIQITSDQSGSFHSKTTGSEILPSGPFTNPQSPSDSQMSTQRRTVHSQLSSYHSFGRPNKKVFIEVDLNEQQMDMKIEKVVPAT